MTAAAERAVPSKTSSRRTGSRPGTALLIVGLLLLSGGRLIANRQHHAYDPAAVPAASVSLIVGHTYQLSTVGGVAALQRQGLIGNGAPELKCSYAGADSPLNAGGSSNSLSLLATYTDPRDLNAFATFRAPSTGRFVLRCQRINAVFVDDAQDAQPGVTTALVALSTMVLVAGVALSLSAAYRTSGGVGTTESATDTEPAGTVAAREHRPQPLSRARHRRG